MNFCEELKWRGLWHEASDPEGLTKLKGHSFYCGFDPTAASVQIGNLVPFMAMQHIAKGGLTPIVLFGGATGAIGDPSGKSAERKLLSRADIDANVAKQRQQFTTLFERLGTRAQFVNNFDWTKEISALDFLRDYGKHFTVNYMLAKDSVNTRIEGDGISYTEFSYMILQALDYLHLYEKHNCRLQVGASDQWGNITAGLELIRKKIQGEAYALTFPLLTNSEGKKFGKSEAGTLWLDPSMTSPFKFHQFFLNTPDNEAVKLLKIFTMFDQGRIAELEAALKSAPEKREAQRALADSICELVHDKSATELAKRSAEVLFGGSMEGLSTKQLEDIFSDVPSSTIARAALSDASVADLFVTSGLLKSKGEARRLISQGGGYVNNQRLSDENQKLSATAFIEQPLLVLRAGKKNYHLLKLAQ